MREALPVLAQLSGERIRNEIDRILIEQNAPEIVAHSYTTRRVENYFPRVEYINDVCMRF